MFVEFTEPHGSRLLVNPDAIAFVEEGREGQAILSIIGRPERLYITDAFDTVAVLLLSRPQAEKEDE